MDRKDRLVQYFNSNTYIPLKIGELKTVLDVPEEDFEELSNILQELEQEGQIMISKRGRIVPITDGDKKAVGVLSCNKSGKFGFVIRDNDDDIYITTANMGPALDGDKVMVKISGKYRGKPEGSVIKVLKRSNKIIVGVVTTRKGMLLKVRPDDSRFYKDISIASGDSCGAKPGMRVAVDGIRINVDGRVFGRIVSILGDKEDLSSLVESIIIENKIKTSFDSDTLLETDKISEEVIWNNEERDDLTDLTTFTIDGEYARDFDDAVSIQKTDDGLYCLGVHIADVSEYIRENSALDYEAFQRATSVYLPDRVIPMIPEKLSNGVCSLNPGVNRLTLSIFMDIDSLGKVVNHRIVKSVICSKERLVYSDINRLLGSGDAELEKKYSHILPDLKHMEELAGILRTKRFDRGAVDFDFPEAEIITDEEGVPTQIKMAERGIANKMIEEFMLIANETVAEFAFWSEIPFVFRCHEAPSEEKLSAFIQFIKPFGLYIKGKIDQDNPVKTKAFKQILDKVKDTPAENIISRTMLRSLMKADYRSENIGHFGLAAKYYCHFTSPIRRYPDLIVHRSLKKLLDGQKQLNVEYVQSCAKHSSEKEISAEICERDCDDLMKAAYMTNYIGMDFDGIITGITSFGMFVEVLNSIEGLVRVENMTEDFYVFNEAEQKLVGERSGKTYTVGDKVSVILVKSDVIARKIDFVLSEDAGHELLDKFREHHKTKKRRKS